MKPFSFLLLFTLTVTVLVSVSISFHHPMVMTFCLLLTSIFIYSKNDFNTRLTCLVIISFLCAQIIVFEFIYKHIHGNYGYAIDIFAFFGVQLLFSSLLLLFIKNRRRVSLMLSSIYPKIKVSEIFKISYVEPLLYFFVALACVVDFLALIEGMINNLDFFGVPKEIAKKYWDFYFIYDIYEYVKLGINMLIIMVIFAGARINLKESST